ncbi:MAG: hypothetical protein Q7W38_01625 [Deltaproteobacteria bacterium]|nr:hypothetical protein [Deltaproteobacteria bacterium]
MAGMVLPKVSWIKAYMFFVSSLRQILNTGSNGPMDPLHLGGDTGLLKLLICLPKKEPTLWRRILRIWGFGNQNFLGLKKLKTDSEPVEKPLLKISSLV